MYDKSLLPDFVIIGAGKSGTTSLDSYLKQHPQIYMSPKKEPNFFALEGMSLEEKSKSSYWQQCITTLDDYVELFRKAPKGLLKGETSPMYLYNETASERIKNYIPEAKLIAILRQPVERLYSRYLHLARDKRLPSENIEDAFDRNSIWWQRNDLIKEGFYHHNLSKYFEIFPEEKIRIYLYEELRSSPKELMKDLFAFLEVEATINIDFSIKLNKSGFIKNNFYDKTIGHNSIIKKIIKELLPKPLYSSAKDNIFLSKTINKVRDRNLRRPKLDKDLKLRFIEEIYKEDILNLEKLINKDLSSWLKAN